MAQTKNIVSIILVAAFFVLFLTGCGGNQTRPIIEDGEFPFRLVYELNGEIFEFEDVIFCEFNGFDLSNAFSFQNRRRWVCELVSNGNRRGITLVQDENVYSPLNPDRFNESMDVSFIIVGSGEYFMGDPNGGRRPRITLIESYRPEVNISRNVSTELTEEQLETYFRINVIELTLSDPIENTFVRD